VRYLVAFLTAVLATLGLALFSGGTASASGEWLGCRISPGYESNFYPSCYTDAGPDGTGDYTLSWVVQNESAASTYSWSAAGYDIVSGCASNTSWCMILAGNYQEIQMSVTLTQGAAAQTLYSTARTPALICDPVCP